LQGDTTQPLKKTTLLAMLLNAATAIWWITFILHTAGRSINRCFELEAVVRGVSHQGLLWAEQRRCDLNLQPTQGD
jgi:hypothetical protein